jgi:hypothetical protein
MKERYDAARAAWTERRNAQRQNTKRPFGRPQRNQPATFPVNYHPQLGMPSGAKPITASHTLASNAAQLHPAPASMTPAPAPMTSTPTAMASTPAAPMTPAPTTPAGIAPVQPMQPAQQTVVNPAPITTVTTTQPMVTTPVAISPMLPTDAIQPGNSMMQNVASFPQPAGMAVPYDPNMIAPTPVIKVEVIYNPTQDQLNSMLNDIWEGLAKGTDRDEASLDLMKMYIAGSHRNKKTDFKAQLVWNPQTQTYDAQTVLPIDVNPDFAEIEMWGQDIIPGMMTLLQQAQNDQNQPLVNQLKTMLENDGYQIPL